MKHCSRCGQEKPLDSFYKDKSRSDGRQRSCIDCARDRSREWNAANPERKRAASRRDYHKHKPQRTAKTVAWQEANPERLNATRRKYRAENQERMLERETAWRQANPEKVRAMKLNDKHKRRAAQRSEDSRKVTMAEMRRIQAMPCVACGSREGIQVDHVVPLARGGAHRLGNLQPLCRPCNLSKGAKLMSEWRYREAVTA